MKKLAFILAAIMIFMSFAACTEKTDQNNDILGRRDDATPNSQSGISDPGTAPTGGAHGVEDKIPVTFDAILQYIESGDTSVFNPHVLDASEQALLKQSVEAAGGKVTFNNDGSFTITGSGMTRVTVYPDGSVEGIDDDGQPFGFSKSKKWPESEIGKALPQADFDIQTVVDDGQSVMISFESVTYEKAKAYGKKLSDAGFTENAEETDMPDNGMYFYSGTSAAGIRADFVFMASSSMCALTGEYYTDPGDWTDDPDDPNWENNGTETELPSEYVFLLPNGKEDYSVLDYTDYLSIEKNNATLSEAKQFASRCESNGFSQYTVQEYKNDDGTDSYFAVYSNGNTEIHISLNILELTLYVDILDLSGQQGDSPVQPDQPGQDQWPTTGVLTKLPKPDFGTGFSISDDYDSYSVVVTGAKASDFNGYMEKVKAAGFTLYSDYETEGGVLLYEAYNSEGYPTFIQYAYEMFILGIGKYPEN